MNPAEIVVGEIQRKRGSQVLPLLAEAISQAGKSADRCSHAEITSLND